MYTIHMSMFNYTLLRMHNYVRLRELRQGAVGATAPLQERPPGPGYIYLLII